MTNERKFTARELLMDGNEGHSFRDVIDNLDEADIIEVIQEYAKIKCKKLLDIVGEKVEKRLTDFEIDKDSILNAVDLETFCS
jgi:16S rRNA C1402 N4-methylase RsmH